MAIVLTHWIGDKHPTSGWQSMESAESIELGRGLKVKQPAATRSFVSPFSCVVRGRALPLVLKGVREQDEAKSYGLGLG